MLKIMMAQLNYLVGDLPGNVGKMIELVRRHGNEVDLIVFSELAATGYYPYDYITRAGFVDAQDEQLLLLQQATAGMRAGVVVGHISRNPFAGKPFFNSLSLIENGARSYTYHKHLLCDYDIFNEPRHFEPGNRPGLVTFRGQRIGFLICEDAWNAADIPLYQVDPVSHLERERLDLVVSINASPSNVRKQLKRHQVIGAAARRCGCPVVYVNQVGGYDDIVFDGASFVAERSGGIGYGLPSFEEALAVIEVGESGAIAPVAASVAAGQLTANPQPMDDIELIYRQSIVGIRDYVGKCGFTGAVVGSSGGVDSAVTLALAVEALGPENVFAITMPNELFSSAGSVRDSEALCANLGIPLYSDPITKEYELWLENYRAVYGKEPERLTRENRQARIRGGKVMAFSNDRPGVLALSTGNKSEVCEGYCTLYGDMCGGLNVLGDIYKTQVYEIGRLHNRLRPERCIPEEIFTKEPSAELSEGQKDSDSLLPYEILDPVLMLFIEHDLLEDEEREECLGKLAGTPTAALERAIRLVDRAQFKRNQAAPIIRVQRRSFGPGWQVPVAARYVDDRFIQEVVGRELPGKGR
ncbi:NAD+ synthase [Geomonas sp. Red32]|uniref:NAD+ synthase n=1 Tax=Geomonas sp. Red32 TaxID=2912856 RepID=UPI00202CDF3E|nr:NAD+ synthase [Geomonas sp. Red32]MCM0082381.1 NAD+ synthase [Geomonas sp. Red32]